MKQSVFKVTYILSIVALFSVGFASWYISGNVKNSTNVSGTIEVGDTEISGHSSYYDLNLTKVLNKTELEEVAIKEVNNPNSIEIFNANFNWKNKENSKYTSKLTNYFDIYDSNNPIGDTSPRIISLDTGDTIRLPMHKLDADNNTLKSSMYYSNSYHIFDDSISDEEKQNLKDLDASNFYSTSDETTAKSNSATIETKTNIDIGNDNFRLDMRRFVKDNKYYYYRLYLFHYTKKTPRKIEVVSSTQLSSFSSALNSSDWFTVSTGPSLVNRIDKKVSTVQIVFSYTNNSGSATKLTVSFNSACYTNTSEYYSKTADNTTMNYSIYRPINEQMPFYSSATIKQTVNNTITWTVSIKYFREEEKNMITTTGTVTTPTGYEFKDASWHLINQIKYPEIVVKFVNSSNSEDVIEKTFNLNTGTRPKSYFYKELDLINRDEIVFVYTIRLRPKEEYIENAKEIISSFNYSIDYNIESMVI